MSCTKDYRFGFNGQEKVNEIAGTGNHNTALFWEYDTRLGRRWNLDPVDQISVSNYVTLGNNPIFGTDLLGNTVTFVKDKSGKNDAEEIHDKKYNKTIPDNKTGEMINNVEYDEKYAEVFDQLNADKSAEFRVYPSMHLEDSEVEGMVTEGYNKEGKQLTNGNGELVFAVIWGQMLIQQAFRGAGPESVLFEELYHCKQILVILRMKFPLKFGHILDAK
jgi:hypothetical protein